MAQNPFIGTWRLVSFERIDSEGQTSYPFGHDFAGYLMYDEKGYMSVAIMGADRPHFASAERIKEGNTDEKVAAVERYISYCGKYEIRGGKIIHHTEIDLFPNAVGTDKERTYKFDDNRLTLSLAPREVEGKQQTARLVWERV